MILTDKKCIIFDLDGTLIDSVQDVYESINYALRKIGYDELSKEKVLELIGPDLQSSLNSMYKDNGFNFNTFINYYRESYETSSTKSTKLFSNCKELLKKCEEFNITLAILTNKPEKQAVDILKELNIYHYFKMVVGPDTYNIAKPQPEGLLNTLKLLNIKKEDAIMIGDTEIDILTCQNASLESIGILHGYRTRKELEKYQPTHIVKDFEELLTSYLFSN